MHFYKQENYDFNEVCRLCLYMCIMYVRAYNSLMLNYDALSIVWMHSSTLAFFAIDAIKASWIDLLFFNREAENKTCKYKLF